MNGPGMHCDPNAYCLLVPETSDFKCECKPGYNGTGKVCTGTADLLLLICKQECLFPYYCLWQLWCKINCLQMYVLDTVTMRVHVWKTREDNHLAAALEVSQANTARRSQSLHTLLVVLPEQLSSSLSLYCSFGWFVLG